MSDLSFEQMLEESFKTIHTVVRSRLLSLLYSLRVMIPSNL